MFGGLWGRWRTGQVWHAVVDLTAGATRMVAPRFGMEDWPRVLHTEPGRVVLGKQLLLTATIETPNRSVPKNPRLHFPGLGNSLHDVPLTQIDADAGVFVGIVESREIPVGRPVAYYFTVQTDSGATLCSELFRLTVVSDISLLSIR